MRITMEDGHLSQTAASSLVMPLGQGKQLLELVDIRYCHRAYGDFVV